MNKFKVTLGMHNGNYAISKCDEVARQYVAPKVNFIIEEKDFKNMFSGRISEVSERIARRLTYKDVIKDTKEKVNEIVPINDLCDMGLG